MKIKLENGKVKIYDYSKKEFFGLLKYQAKLYIKMLDGSDFIIEKKDDYGNVKTNKGDMDFLDLLTHLKMGVESVYMEKFDFRRGEQLLMNLDKTDDKKILSSSYIDFFDNIFKIVYKPESNGASNKMYYFEDNNTFLFFDKNGPNLKTETKSSTFLDMIS